MSAFGILGFACAYAGTETAQVVPLAVISMLVVGLLAGLARVYGDEGSTVGLFIAVIYAVAVGSPSPVPHVSAAPRRDVRTAAWHGRWCCRCFCGRSTRFAPHAAQSPSVYRALAEFARSLEQVTLALGHATA